jgi:hypothetical protein
LYGSIKEREGTVKPAAQLAISNEQWAISNEQWKIFDDNP